MPIIADKVKELAARVEGTKLDFKQADYDWTNKSNANAELAKDIMAMANSLNPSSMPSHILIGVDGAGTIVGIPPGSHVDDAVLHQKVGGLLNKSPKFSYGAVEVDGISVGVYEIRYSKRPFYPTKDVVGTLRQNVPLYRDGSSTKQATPDLVHEWAREDDPEARELRSLELLKLKAEARVRGRLHSVSYSTAVNGFETRLVVYNDGQSGFWVRTLHWQVEWGEPAWLAQKQAGVRVGLPEGYVPAQGDMHLDSDRLVAPGSNVDFQFKWTYDDVLAHYKAAQLDIPGFNGKFASYHFSLRCRGELGGEETLETTVRP